MAQKTVRLQPGVNLEASPTLNQTQLAQTNLIRFYGGLAQKLGGWTHMNSIPLIGTCRGMAGWSDLVGNSYIACGTEQRVQVLTGGSIEDITPIVQTENPPVAFSTTAGSAAVTLTDTAYQPSIGDWIFLATQVSIGGIVVVGFYQVQSTIGGTRYTVTAASAATSTVSSGGAVATFTTATGSAIVTVTLDNHGVTAGSSITFNLSTTVGGTTVSAGTYVAVTIISANQFTITVDTAATSVATVAMNSGNAQVQYLLPTGYVVNTPLDGYGVGDYGEGDYGTAGTEQIIGNLRQWSMYNWGSSLIASPTGGGIYYWTPPNPTPPLQVVASTAPTINNAVFVIPQARIIVALGASTSGETNPLLVQWCDADDFTDWTPSATNQAGSYQLSSGSTIVGANVVGLGVLIWTDVDVWFMQYIGYPLVFSFQQLCGSCGLAGMRTYGDAAGSSMWLSTRGFFAYQSGAGVDAVECPVWDFIFDNIDLLQLGQAHCAVNSLFNEMAWYFPIVSTSPIYDANAPLGYVKWNFIENVWDYGQSSQLQRTAWVEKNPESNPCGTDLNGLIQQHEVSPDADGAGMAWSWTSGYFSVDDGEEFLKVDLIIPDFVMTWIANPPVFQISLLGVDDPFDLVNNPPQTDGPYTVTAGQTLRVPVNLRARQIALQVAGNDIGTFNRIGGIRVRYKLDGRN